MHAVPIVSIYTNLKVNLFRPTPLFTNLSDISPKTIDPIITPTMKSELDVAIRYAFLHVKSYYNNKKIYQIGGLKSAIIY